MAVLQISKIQVRRGQESQTSIPTLSAGEFAWAIDTQNLYIGNGAVSDGAPFVGNTRILTANDAGNLFQLANTYSFQGNTGATIHTGPTANSPVYRTLQSKLDDAITVVDFGCVGDYNGNAGTDNTRNLQNAIDQLFLNPSDKLNPKSKRPLHIPAGTYLITGTIYIPPNVTLVGDGSGKTVIVQSGLGVPVFMTCDSTSTYGVKEVWPNIRGAYKPRNINISGMTVHYDTNTHQIGNDGLLDLDCAIDTVIDDVQFLGVASSPLNDSVKGIQIRGQGTALTSDNIQINRCKFEKLNCGVYSDYDITNLKITNSKFTKMGVGVSIAAILAPGDNTRIHGPVDVKILNNNFETVYKQAIFVGSNTGNVSNLVLSQNNQFNSCGNLGNVLQDQAQSFEVITFFSPGNISTNDFFTRDDENAKGTPSPMIPSIKGHAVITGNKVNTLQLPTNLTTNVVTIAAGATSEQILVDYIATSTNLTRIGKLQILVDANTATVYDSFQYQGTAIGDTMRFTATVASNVVTLSAINLNNPTTNLTYKINQLY
jgi:hypothetical protein